MNRPNPRDLINKSMYTMVVESIRDSVSTNLIQASQSGQLDVKGPDLQKLIMIVNGAIDAGYQRCSRGFMIEVDNALTQATQTTQQPETKKNSG